MIAVRALPEIELTEDRGWSLTLWLSLGFDYSAPFRSYVDEIASLFSEQAPVVRLPPYEQGEDFVFGSLLIGVADFKLYLEYALGYIDISSTEKSSMEDLAGRLKGIVALGLDEAGGA